MLADDVLEKMATRSMVVINLVHTTEKVAEYHNAKKGVRIS